MIELHLRSFQHPEHVAMEKIDLSPEAFRQKLQEFVEEFGPSEFSQYQRIARGEISRFPGPDGHYPTLWGVTAGILEVCPPRSRGGIFKGAGTFHKVPERYKEAVLNALIDKDGTLHIEP